ncbi:hypothetical protein KUTeg_019967 [Tegillarca granosa]|uniref:Major facilitator superfamily (MFS) profile domain-containing protein n=1 Tax=Tegillarca granosa TaxID=220873 RepID=A0ABQ9EGN0_TEGGR|nr:hypothetical protein KUTeg_019967 [Tegillarca granosa]
MAERKVKYTFTLIFSTAVAIFGNSFLYGYNIGVVNNPAEVVRRFYAQLLLERAGVLHHDDSAIKTNMATTQESPTVTIISLNSSSPVGNVSITDDEEINKEVEEDPVLELLWSITVAIFVLFGMFGAFASNKVADHFGRKKGMILITVFMFIAGLCMSLVSLYLAEIAPKEIPFVCLVCMPFCPESPRFLLINKKKEHDARKAMQRLRGYNDVEDEMDEMKIEASKTQNVRAFTIKQLLVTPGLRLPTFIATMSMASQQWSGINAVMSYSSFMFKNAGVPSDVIQWVVVGSSVVNFLSTFICIWLVEKAGRRPLLLYPTVIMLISFIFLTIFHNLQYVESLEENHSAFAIIGIISMHTYVIGFAIGMGPIPYLMSGELFRQDARAAATGLCLATNWITNFILLLIFRFMQRAMKGFVYVPFIVVLVISLVYIYYLVPETKNKTFEEIAASLSFGRKKRKPYKNGTNSEELKKMTT